MSCSLYHREVGVARYLQSFDLCFFPFAVTMVRLKMCGECKEVESTDSTAALKENFPLVYDRSARYRWKCPWFKSQLKELPVE